MCKPIDYVHSLIFRQCTPLLSTNSLFRNGHMCCSKTGDILRFSVRIVRRESSFTMWSNVSSDFVKAAKIFLELTGDLDQFLIKTSRSAFPNLTMSSPIRFWLLPSETLHRNSMVRWNDKAYMYSLTFIITENDFFNISMKSIWIRKMADEERSNIELFMEIDIVSMFFSWRWEERRYSDLIRKFIHFKNRNSSLESSNSGLVGPASYLEWVWEQLHDDHNQEGGNLDSEYRIVWPVRICIRNKHYLNLEFAFEIKITLFIRKMKFTYKSDKQIEYQGL